VSILVPSWRTYPSTKRLLEAFPNPSSIRFVGGCVRDALLGVDSSDLDLATTLTPNEVIDLLSQAGLKPIPTGLEHGTVTVFVEEQRFEITTLRKDVETDGRRAVVAFSTDWLEDAARRDFTFNALYLDLEGRLFDPWNGVADLKKGLVRFIGTPRERVQEDGLRILRFFRFVTRFQKAPLDPDALETCQQYKALLTTLSRERVSQEICLLLGAKNPHALRDVLSLMVDTGVWETLFASAPNLHFWKKALALEGQDGPEISLRRRLALIFWPTPRALETLRLPRALMGELGKIYKAVAGQKDLHIVLYELGPSMARDWLLLRRALGLLSHSVPSTLAQALDLLTQTLPPFPLTGHDFKAHNITGPSLGLVLRHVQHWWAGENFIPSKQDCVRQGLAYFQSLQKNGSSTTRSQAP
jgi:poly(A) polymerase